MIALGLALALAGAPPASREAEARRIETELIAPCCWAQQVSVHSSPAADQMRSDIRLRLAAGQGHQQILDAYVAQYGQAILAEPPARGSNLALYVLPPVAFAASAALLVVLVRRFSSAAAVPAAAPGRAVTPPAPDTEVSERLDDELARLD